jgi:hypothetical protein
MRTRHLALFVAFAAALALSPGLQAYLKLGTTINGRGLLL